DAAEGNGDGEVDQGDESEGLDRSVGLGRKKLRRVHEILDTDQGDQGTLLKYPDRVGYQDGHGETGCLGQNHVDGLRPAVEAEGDGGVKLRGRYGLHGGPVSFRVERREV